MAKRERYLHFSNLEVGQPISAQCDVCDRLFERKPKPEKERTTCCWTSAQSLTPTTAKRSPVTAGKDRAFIPKKT